MGANKPPLDYAPPRPTRSGRSWRLRRAREALGMTVVYGIASAAAFAYAWLKAPRPNPLGMTGVIKCSPLGLLLASVTLACGLLTVAWLIDWLSARHED